MKMQGKLGQRKAELRALKAAVKSAEQTMAAQTAELGKKDQALHQAKARLDEHGSCNPGQLQRLTAANEQLQQAVTGSASPCFFTSKLWACISKPGACFISANAS